MMKVLVYIILVFAIFSACSPIERGRVVGSYDSNVDSHRSDGLDIDVDINTKINFEWLGLDCESNIVLLFIFDEKLNYPNIELRYVTHIGGDWTINDDVLTLDLDTTSFTYDFAGSNATRPTERTMVRNLRKYVGDVYMPVVRERIVNMNSRSVNIVQCSDSLLIVANNDTGNKMELRKID